MSRPGDRKGIDKTISVCPTRCTGCRTCEMICSFKHTSRFNPELSRIRVSKTEEAGLDLPKVCLHCQDPVCVEVCPRKSLYFTKKGVAVIDPGRCQGCGICAKACPIGAIAIHEGQVIKCDLCEGRPQCVKWCSTGALSFGCRNLTSSELKEELAAKS